MPTPETFPLYPNLPLELRQQILSHALPPPSTIDIKQHLPTSPSPKHPSFLPPLCLASNKTCQDATPLFLSLHKFKLRSHRALLFFRAFLATLDRGVESVRGLEFASFHWFPGVGAAAGGRSDDVGLVVACKGLRWLGITLHVQNLMSRRRNAKGDVEPMGPEEIVAKYDMEGVFGCGMLETVVLDACDQLHVFEESARDTEEVVEEFAEWMRGRFRGVGREVNIGVEWRGRWFRRDNVV